ncbi:TIGR02678 family protein [Rhodococcus chondri]|uniref:TIGR02678 family protein n=1 Tax=Rhodococcus chondri TaxID=3065941 RepID=A0ABU7JVI3_9NOCA|nr:TIGR02678 family protein [Rhodococcus sp. CC-R104]MEE2034038.1 TIGR02678 family protein [Rhodococcus sp. CC-R104]
MTVSGSGTAVGTAAQDAAGRRDAARALLQQPILTAAHDPATFELVRRHATALRSLFSDRLGYTLVVEDSFARLLKSPLAPTAPARPLRRSSGDEFGAITYTYLALLCAALLAPGVGDQVLVSALVEQVRVDAAEQGIAVADTVTERRHLVAALQILLEWGVLTETDGSVGDWADGDAEALFTVTRPVLTQLSARALHDTTGPAELQASPRQYSPRQLLYRTLVENPFTARTDLDPATAEVLIRERSDVARRLDEDFGLVLEVRTEGALAYDPDGDLTDEPFPGVGTVKQAALLLVSKLVEDADPAPGTALHVEGAALDEALRELVSVHARSWRGEYVRDLSALRRDVVSLLHRLALAHSVDDGLLLAAPAARYRFTAPERTAE